MSNEKKEQGKNPINENSTLQFDEAQAFFELLAIIQEAIESQDLAAFESNVNLWQKNYPIDKFSPYFKSRIKYLLSKSYLRTVLILPIEIKIHQEFKQDKAYSDLCIIVHRAKLHKDLEKLEKEINKWKSANSVDKFNKYYKPRINRLINPNNFNKITGAFNQKTAFEELEKIINDSSRMQNIDELNKGLENWGKQYNPKDFGTEYSSKVNNLLREDFLSSLFETVDASKEQTQLTDEDLTSSQLTAEIIQKYAPPNQRSAYFELLDVFKNPKDIIGVFNWAYKYRFIVEKFDDKHKEAILALISDHYHIPKQSVYQIPDVSQTNWNETINKNNYIFSKAPTLGLNNFKEINALRKEATIQFFAMLLNNQKLSSDDYSRFNLLYSQSQEALQITSFLKDEKDDILQIKDTLSENNNKEDFFVVDPEKLFVDTKLLESLDEVNNLNPERDNSAIMRSSNLIQKTKSTKHKVQEDSETQPEQNFFENTENTFFELSEEDSFKKNDEEKAFDDSDPTTFFRNLEL